jgi:hypothetical protein
LAQARRCPDVSAGGNESPQHGGASANNRFIRYLDIFQEHRACSNEAPPAEKYATRDVHPGAEGAEVADLGVVTNRAVQIEMNECTNLDVGCQNGPRTHNSPSVKLHCAGSRIHSYRRVDQRRVFHYFNRLSAFSMETLSELW